MNMLARTWNPSKLDPGVKYQVRGLTGLEYLDFQSLMVAELGEKAFRILEVTGKGRLTRNIMVWLLDTALLGWDGRKDGEGEPLAYSKKAAYELTFPQMGEVLDMVMDLSGLGEEAVKNLSSQSRSQLTPGSSTADDASTADTATTATPPRSSNSSSPESSKAEPASKPCRPASPGN